MPLLPVLLLAAALGAERSANRAVLRAEHDRIADEMRRLAERQVWAGVERKFRQLERLGVELTAEDYLQGAYAARELGDMLACYERLKRAARLDGTKEVVDWLWDIDQNYSRVELISVPPKSAELVVEEMPFDPNQRKAVEAAIRSAREDGIYVGMLPRGTYTFAGQQFTVEPGVSVRIEVSRKMRRRGIIDPVIVYRDESGAIIEKPLRQPARDHEEGEE